MIKPTIGRVVWYRSPEWPNLLSHQEVLEAIDDAQRCMRAEIAQKGRQVAALEARVAYLKVRGYLCPICEYPCLENVACLMCGLKARNQELESALERIASDFETDFVIDGQVVDEPYRTHEWAWRAARAALKGAS